MTTYFSSDYERPFSDHDLSRAERETQLDVMETWFRHHFEDPAERTLYQSSEGGYIWIWGGPYDARELLESEFDGIVPRELIVELADRLSSECWEWAPTPSPGDYDDQLVNDIARISNYYHNFSGAILDIEKLLAAEVGESVAPCLRRLLFVNVITALETFLSDAFINTVVNTPALMRRFIETTPEFKSEKVALSAIFEAMESIEKRARGYLIDMVWHHLDRVRLLYRDTLKIEFPVDSGPIFRAISTRHDIVHRNGKTKSGEEIFVSPKDVISLIRAAESFSRQIDVQLAELRSEMDTAKSVAGGSTEPPHPASTF